MCNELSTESRRHAVPASREWGSQWKKAVAETYTRALGLATTFQLVQLRDVVSISIRPTRTPPRLGRPLMRMTFDFHQNELRCPPTSRIGWQRLRAALDPVRFAALRARGLTPDAIRRTHNTGGHRDGLPIRDQRGQSLLPERTAHVFVPARVGVSQTTATTPTDTVARLAYWTADAINGRYLKTPSRWCE